MTLDYPWIIPGAASVLRVDVGEPTLKWVDTAFATSGRRSPEGW